MESLVEFLVSLFGGISKEVIIFIISLMPILELRGGLVAAKFLEVEFVRAAGICILGNVLPIPFVLLFLKFVLDILSKWSFTKKIVTWLEKKVEEKRPQIDKYGYLGLILFVGIPLPGTGAWTGALLAVLLKMKPLKALLSILLGVMTAGLVMSLLAFGLIQNII